MPGEHAETLAHTPVRDRDAGRGRDRDRAGHPRHHLDGDTSGQARLDLLAAAAEHERVAALEPDHRTARAGVLDQCVVDVVLPHGRPAGHLGRVHHVHAGRQLLQQGQRREPVGHHHVGLPQPAQPGHRDQPGIPRPTADDRHPSRRPLPAGRRLLFFCCRTSGLRDGVHEAVTEFRGTPRVAARVDRYGHRARPAHRGNPGRGGGRVVGAGAPQVLPLGVRRHGLVHLRPVRAGQDQPGAVGVAGLVLAPVCGDQPAVREVGQCRGEPRGHHQDLGTCLAQPGHPPQRHRATAHHQHPAPLQPQAEGVYGRSRGWCGWGGGGGRFGRWWGSARAGGRGGGSG